MKNQIKIILIITILFISGCSYRNNAETKEINIPYDNILELNRVLPHNQDSFTEGLFFHDGKLYESVGLYGKSNLYSNINLENGKPEKIIKIDDNIFAEGSVALNNKLYLLTYKENKILVYDINTQKLLKTYPYHKEGWGLTTDGKYLIASDGTNQVYYLDENLEIVKTINIIMDGKQVNNINELEYIDGYIWANIWKTNDIIIINKDNGEIIKKLDFTKLLNKYLKDYPNVDSFNGIAYNNDKLYLTGKHYPYMFEFIIKNKVN